MTPDKLHVISVISNPMRFQTRTKLMKEFIKRIEPSGVQHWIIEATFGERPHEVAEENNPYHIRVRCDHEIWVKENLINKAISKLPADWKYVMWLDADVEFMRDDWATEIIQALQHYSVVQPFSHAVDLGPNHEVINTTTGFAYCHLQGKTLGDKYGPYFHPGYCWAWRREAWDAVGGMIDHGIAGSGDDHMAKALIGKADRSMPPGLHPNYIHMIKAWEKRAVDNIKHNIGYVAGSLLHYWHGKKANRNYWSRWDILKTNQYDPYVDVVKDSQGILQLVGNKPKLRDGLRAYFRQRNEDDNCA